MLFREGPVDRPEELFDREEEFKELRDALNSRRLVLLLGVRRVGKTSLLGRLPTTGRGCM